MCIYHNFIHLSVAKTFRCLRILAVANDAATDLGAQISF